MTTPLTLWVSPVSNLAGVARHILDVARADIPGWRLHVAAPEGPLLDELRALGVATTPIPFDSSFGKSVRVLRALVSRLKPQIVHSHLAKADFAVALVCVGLPPKLVSTEHGIAADPLLYNTKPIIAWAKQRAHRLRCRRFAHIIAVSQSTAEQIQHHWSPKTPVTVVLNGVDRPEHTPARRPGKRYLSLSRLSHEKNIAAIVTAFARLDAEATLTVAGDGPDREAISAQVRELGLEDRVSLPGNLEAQQALAEHDVLVQLSKWENASYSLLDATVNGLGVVATPVGGNPEILPPRCLVVAEKVDAVAQCMREQAELNARPVLRESWPTVAEMTQQIARVYMEVSR